MPRLVQVSLLLNLMEASLTRPTSDMERMSLAWPRGRLVLVLVLVLVLCFRLEAAVASAGVLGLGLEAAVSVLACVSSMLVLWRAISFWAARFSKDFPIFLMTRILTEFRGLKAPLASACCTTSVLPVSEAAVALRCILRSYSTDPSTSTRVLRFLHQP